LQRFISVTDRASRFVLRTIVYRGTLVENTMLPVMATFVLYTSVQRNGCLHRSQCAFLILLATFSCAYNQSFRQSYFFSRSSRLEKVHYCFNVRIIGNRLDFDHQAHHGYAGCQASCTIPACLDQLMTVSAFVYVSPSIISAVDCRLLYRAGLCIYRPSHRFGCCSALIALLLLIANVEPNPGPQCHRTISFGLLNARSSVNKAALIHDVIGDLALMWPPLLKPRCCLMILTPLS